MTDRLTQLQDCLDDLLTQMYASLTYIQTRHPYGDIAGQPSQAPPPAPTPTFNSAAASPAAARLTNGDASQASAKPDGQPAQGGERQEQRPSTPPPDTPAAFNSALRELAEDLVLKEQQVEYIINSLPGLGNTEADQVQRMRKLEAELREVEKRRAEAENERENLAAVLGQVIVSATRVP